MKTETNERLIRIKEVMHRTGLSQSNIYARIADGNFPKQIHLGIRSVVWIESQVQDWIQKKIKEGD